MKSLRLVIALLCSFTLRAQETDPGRKLFESRCAPCHGLDGAGGEFGRSIVDRPRSGARAGRTVADIISNGIRDSGMPAFTIPQQQLDLLVAFVEALRSPASEHPAEGSVAAGESFFFGKG